MDANSPSAKAMAWVKNRNNISDMYLRKRLDVFERQRDINMTLIDQDKLDVKDFMKSIKKCDSNQLPESRHWLTNEDERLSLSRRRQSTVLRPAQRRRGLLSQQEEETNDGEDEDHGERTEEERYGFPPQHEQPQLVQRATTMGLIYQQRNRLVLDPKTLSYAGRDVDLISRDTDSRADDVSSGHLGLERAVTFHGTIGRQDSDSLPSRDSGDPGSSNMRAISSGSSTGRQEKRQSRLPKPPKTAPAGGGATGGRDFMKEVVMRKYQHRRHRRPIEDRLEEFYTKIDDTLAQEEEEELKATDKETVKRKWALITKGVQAALMIGRDNEDGEDGED